MEIMSFLGGIDMALGYDQTLKAVELIEESGSVANIVGMAGIGKSALVNDLAKQRKAKLFTTVVSLVEKGDMAIPVPPLTDKSFIKTKNYGRLADVQYGYSHTLIEIIQYAQNHPDTEIFWFLDEFNRGTPSVQSELMNLVLQRQINSLKLPQQVKIIIAENPENDGDYQVFASDDAINDRTIQIKMVVNVDNWLQWASQEAKLNHYVIGYIKEHPLSLYQGNEVIKPTPRAWERVAHILDRVDDLKSQTDILLEIVSGNVGSEIATSFQQYILSSDELTVENLIKTDVDMVVVQLKRCSEIKRQHLVNAMISQIYTITPDISQRLYQYITLLSPDGQFAIALALLNTDGLIDNVYRNINQADSNYQLYTLLTTISFREYR